MKPQKGWLSQLKEQGALAKDVEELVAQEERVKYPWPWEFVLLVSGPGYTPCILCFCPNSDGKWR